MSNHSNKIILALDYANANNAIQMAQIFKDTQIKFKIGMELFYAEGPGIVEKIQKYGDVFLDLKLHDIPQTMAKTASVLTKIGVWMFNVHASAGKSALKKVSEEVQNTSVNTQGNKPLIIAVTVLTSLESLAHLGTTKTAKESAFDLAKLSYEQKLDGVVCSAQDVQQIKSISENFLCVTPGIRLESKSQDDQKRIMTPKQAIQNGSDYLVIGRPITQSKDPRKVLESIIDSIQ